MQRERYVQLRAATVCIQAHHRKHRAQTHFKRVGPGSRSNHSHPKSASFPVYSTCIAFHICMKIVQLRQQNCLKIPWCPGGGQECPSD